MTKVFLDADVVLDFYVERQPHHNIALRLFSELKQSKVRCYTSVLVVANVYYVLSKIEGKQYAIDKMRRLRKLVAIASMDESIIDDALASPYKDFEDSIQFHCAVRNGIKTLITRNAKDYPKGRLLIAEPIQYLNAAALEKES
jgi:predicted nucleic acid-binding protein